MIKIDKHNVEAYYLDYLEGNLAEEDTVLLFQFIDDNPELAELFEDADDLLDINLKDSEHIVFPDKDELKTLPCKEDEICLNNIDYWLIAKAENTLTKEETTTVDAFVRSNDLSDTEAYIKAAYLKPDLEETFGNTDALKKKTTIILPLLYRAVGIAAAFILVWMVLRPGTNTDKQYYSKRNDQLKEVVPLYNSKEKNPVYRYNSDITIAGRTADISTNSVQNNATKSSKGTVKKNEDEEKRRTVEFFQKSFDALSVESEPFVNNPPKAIPESIDISTVFSDLEIALLERDNQEDSNSDLASVSGHNRQLNDQLKEYYKPVTSKLSDLTSLDMSYKRAPENADIKRTVIQIGNFSFERKRKK